MKPPQTPYREVTRMKHNIYLYIPVIALVTYAIRALPLTLIRKPIKSRFIRSFLFYVPYVTLSVMTFPAILYVVEGNILPGLVALIVGIITAWLTGNLFIVASLSCIVVYVLQLFI